MGKQVVLADQDVVEVMERVIDRHDHFEPIRRSQLEIQVVMAWKEKGPALRHGGVPAAATISVSTPEERAIGGPDVWIHVDGNRYSTMSPRSREALFAHELRHLKVTALRDDYGRPVVRMVKDDWTINGFKDVAEWYGKDAVEVRSLEAVRQLLRQGSLFPDVAPNESEEDDVDAAATRSSRPSVAVAASADMVDETPDEPLELSSQPRKKAKKKSDSKLNPAESKSETAAYLVFKGDGKFPACVVRANSLASAVEHAKTLAKGEYEPRLRLDRDGKAKSMGLPEHHAPGLSAASS